MDFSNNLITWYDSNKRDLPWRHTKNPYYIWISEIILQQTRVEQGLPYYLRFIDEFPDIEKLAQAKEDKVLKLWQGLGYYSRARNLHYTAKEIIKYHNGRLPRDYNKLLKLKGIGKYTAAAIASFVFDLPFAVVDGNVVRLLSRFFGIKIPIDTYYGKKQFQELAEKLLIKDQPGTYNQAIMEFGALQCKPKSPNCSVCIINESCHAYNYNEVYELPVKIKKNKIKKRYLHFLIIESDSNICIKKRDKGIWKGLYEFPFLEFSGKMLNAQVLESSLWKRFFMDSIAEVKMISKEYKHQLSHQIIYAKFWLVETNSSPPKGTLIIRKSQLYKYPVSRLIEKYLKTVDWS